MPKELRKRRPSVLPRNHKDQLPYIRDAIRIVGRRFRAGGWDAKLTRECEQVVACLEALDKRVAQEIEDYKARGEIRKMREQVKKEGGLKPPELEEKLVPDPLSS